EERSRTSSTIWEERSRTSSTIGRRSPGHRPPSGRRSPGHVHHLGGDLQDIVHHLGGDFQCDPDQLKESRRRGKTQRTHTLTENHIFIMELARELSWICQSSGVLSHIWRGGDVWSVSVCHQFITETASILHMKEKTDAQYMTHTHPCVRMQECEDELQCVSQAEENERKREIMDWTHTQRNKHPMFWELQWIKGRVPHLQSALELLIWITHNEHLDKEFVPRLWLRNKQEIHRISNAHHGGFGVCVDFEAGQISFYDVRSHTHIYTYCETLTEPVYPVFGTTEILTHMKIAHPQPCEGACPFC
ncbi:hypothetical protein QTP86_029184, partial [Hemibagrus guttatus]